MTSTRSRRFVICLATAFVGLAALVNCGCLLVAAGTAAGALTGAAYVNGNVTATYFAFPNDVWAATRQGLTELGMPLKKEVFDGFKGSLESCTAEGDKVSVTIECMSPPGLVDGAMTKLGIRIASFGDRHASERIFRQIGGHIPAPILPPASGGFAFQGRDGPMGNRVGSIANPLTATNYVGPEPTGKPPMMPSREPPLASVPDSSSRPQAANAPSSVPSQVDPSTTNVPKIPELPLAPVPAISSRGTGG